MKKIIIIILFIFILPIMADTSPRYLIISTNGHGYIWYWSENPYQIIEEMCWNSSEGFNCDNRFDTTSSWEFEVIDFQELDFGSIYKNDYGCYIFWWLSEYGDDNNPHVENAYWIECLE